jgi:7-cyano-7-deazaguanine synthase
MKNELINEIKSKCTKCVVSLSGGLDSTILTYLLVESLGKENVIAISYNYNQRHDIELQKAKITTTKLGIKHAIQDISFLGDIVKNVSAMVKGPVETPTIEDVLGDPQPVTYVPYRNLILNSLTLAYAESFQCNGVASGWQKQDTYAYWDTSEDFMKGVQNVANLNRKHGCKIVTPFVNLAKADEIKLALDLKVPFEDTWTCYNPQVVNEEYLACKTCPSCSERLAAFKKNNIVDLVKYI